MPTLRRAGHAPSTAIREGASDHLWVTATSGTDSGTLATYRRAVRQRYDAIVVGSGFGGGIAACRLAEAGRSVCVLERGRRFGREDFVDRPEQAGNSSGTRARTPAGCSTCGSCAIWW